LKNIIWVVLLFLVQFSFANEEGILKGRVLDALGGMTGVTVHIKNTSFGTSTNSIGEYNFTVPNGEIIVVVSALGYKTKEVKVVVKKHETTILNIKLDEDVFGLDQIVVTGTKTFKR